MTISATSPARTLVIDSTDILTGFAWAKRQPIVKYSDNMFFIMKFVLFSGAKSKGVKGLTQPLFQFEEWRFFTVNLYF